MSNDISNTNPEEITLTEDQDNALSAFVNFLSSPVEQVFVLEGYSGTGKSTLIKTLMDRLHGYLKTIKLLNPAMPDYTVQLTATTNKAAETFGEITGMEVSTVHSFLGLIVNTDYKTGQTRLSIKKGANRIVQHLIFIDEASYIDSKLLGLIFEQTVQCKIVFIGDRAQLSPVKSTNTPVFHAGFKGAMLTKPMRQLVNGVPKANPITDLATQFRETVETGIWTPFKPDGQYVKHMKLDEFEDAILAEFTRPEWRYKDSKILGWTNKCVIGYNNAVNNHVTGDPNFRVGDYVVCNKFVSSGGVTLKTDELVYITSIEDPVEELGVIGNFFTLNYTKRFFYPKSAEDKKKRMSLAKANDNYHDMRTISDAWIDLRQAFAQTVNKAQGSTYGIVFIDITDIARCNSGDQVARMMYVAVSRARNMVYLTGDFG